MMGIDTTPPPPSAAADLFALLASVRLLADPAAAEARIAALRDAINDFNAAKVEAERAIAESQRTLAAHAAQIAKERGAHNAAMADERNKLEQECAYRLAEIKARDAKSREVFEFAEADKQLTAELRADAEQRPPSSATCNRVQLPLPLRSNLPS